MTPDVPVFVFNRRPQTISIPLHKPITTDAYGNKDMSPPTHVVCRPGFSKVMLSDIRSARMDDPRLRTHRETIELVWLANSPPPSDEYVSIRDLGQSDTLAAIAGTHDRGVLELIVGSPSTCSKVVCEAANKRDRDIAAGKPQPVGGTLARDDGGMIDMGTV